MTKIYVGVDGSTSAAAALVWAVEEGAVRGWPVRAVLAWTYLDQAKVDPDQAFDPDYDRQDAARALEQFVVAALGTDGAARVEQAVVCDLPAAALLDAAGEDDLLVVGARGLGGFKGLLLGSVSQQCLHHATGPVAVVHESSSGSSKGAGRVVVGIDGSSGADAALRWAVEECRARDAELEVVHAWHLPYLGDPAYGVVSVDPSPYEEAVRATVEQAIETSGADTLDRPARRTIVRDGASSAVLGAAADADLVVVGTRGLGGFRSLLLGSVSSQVAAHTPCPVILVPHGEPT